MRTAVWLLVIVAIGAIAWADLPTGTVIVSCNETDASMLVDGVMIPDRTPAVLTLTAGTHVIEVRKPPLVSQKKTIAVADQQQIKLRFELVSAAAPSPPPGPDAPTGSGSAAPPLTGSAAPPLTGSGAPPGAGSAQVTATGSAAPPESGSAAPAAGSAAPRPVVAASAPAHTCRQGNREVPCPPEGPHCTQGGKPVSCTTGAPLPPPAPPAPPAPPVAAVAAGSAAGSAAGTAPGEQPASSGLAAIEIVTTVPRAIAYVDGAPVRDAPCVLELEPGEHVVAVYAAGMVPAEAVVHAELARRQRVELSPSKPRQRINVPAP